MLIKNFAPRLVGLYVRLQGCLVVVNEPLQMVRPLGVSEGVWDLLWIEELVNVKTTKSLTKLKSFKIF
jgi:hypothetical protein